MSALDTPSGAFPIITRRAAHRRSDPAPPSSPSAWLSAGAIASVGGVLGLLAVPLAIIYALVAITSAGLLLAATTATAVLAGVALLLALAVRTLCRRQEAAAGHVADRVDALRAALAEQRDTLEGVPQEMARLVAQVRVVAAEVPELAEAVRELAVRVEAAEATVAAASTAQAIISRVDGTVVPMRPGGHSGGR